MINIMSLLSKEKKYMINLIKKIIVTQKIRNYYYIQIIAIPQKEKNLYMEAIDVNQIKKNGTKLIAKLIIVILDIIIINMNKNVSKNAILIFLKIIIYLMILNIIRIILKKI